MTVCPLSYYHSFNDKKGRCLLNCPSGSIYDNATKTCNCPNSIPQDGHSKFACVNTTTYFFGCQCSTNFLDFSTQRCISSIFMII